jgi:hypothetical protein
MNDEKLDKWWVNISDELLEKFIQGWFAELDLDDDDNSQFGEDVVLMNFFASEEFQWKFIMRTFTLAYDANHLSAMAAGPVEHLLAFHGEKWIEKIEKESLANDNFAWMMTSVWQHKMSDEIWNRVQIIQKQAEQ